MHQSRFAFSYGRLHFPHEKCLLLKTRIYEKLNQLKPVQFGAGMMVRLLAALPQSVVGAILTKALNDALAELLLDGEFEFLSEKICEIYFSDL